MAASRLYDAIAAEYDQVGPPFFARRGAELVAAAGIAHGWRVLDAGCGRGACLFPAAEAVGATGSVVGIDVSGGMVAETRAEVRRRGLAQVTVDVGDAEDPGVGDRELLRRAGFGSVEVVDEAHVIELPDLDRWWEYLWHSGYRGTMMRIPAGRREDARRAVTEAARGLSEPDGRVLMRVQVRVALATRPPDGEVVGG